MNYLHTERRAANVLITWQGRAVYRYHGTPDPSVLPYLTRVTSRPAPVYQQHSWPDIPTGNSRQQTADSRQHTADSSSK